MRTRYIVWRKAGASNPIPVAEVLKGVPGVKVLRHNDLHSAVVMMEPGTEAKLRHQLPELAIEHDVQYALASSR